jgi:hypothetical protein
VTDFLAQVVVWLSAAADAVGGILLAPVAALPGWLSATLIAVLTGVLMLVVFKYTSHQRAIKAVRADIKAQLLTLKLFRDSTWVVLRAQGRILLGALELLVLAIVPLLVMTVPMLLLLAQIALWFQARPLRVNEEAVITLKLNRGDQATMPRVHLEPTSAADVVVGPLRVFSQREVCWNIKANENGYHRLAFHVDGQTIDKELAVGDGFMRVSTERPGWDWWDVLLNPLERPFAPDSPVQDIKIAYPGRSSWTSGTNKWVYYWFAVSFVSALCFRRAFDVNL